MEKRSDSSRILIGWREWIAIPELGIPAIKAKIDTGAKTSALHAFSITSFTERGRTRVRFLMHPLQNRPDIVVTSEADVIDHRVVTDSGGHREKRYVIEAPILMAGLEWIVEFTLTNRETMTYRMLLGRSAMKNKLIVEPGKSFLLGRAMKPAQFYKRMRKKT